MTNRPKSSAKTITVALSVGLLSLAIPIFIVLFSLSAANELQAAPLLQADLPDISFANSSITQEEGDVTVNITVEIDSRPLITQTAEIEYLTVDGTATDGTGDYEGTSGMLTFTFTETASHDFTTPYTKNFSVEINEDSTPEVTEVVNLILRNPVNANLVSPSQAQIFITDNDPTATPTTDGPPTFVDAYEPNNDFNNAFETAAVRNPGSNDRLCGATLWPVGDVDYFSFPAKAGSYYRITTESLDTGLDTRLVLYNPSGNEISRNDDATEDTRASLIDFVASRDGFHFVRVENLSPVDPTGLEYCLKLEELDTPTPTPSNTPVPGEDECEFNSTLETACTLGVGQAFSASFVPSAGSEQDTDYYRLWVKPGIFYTCETQNLSAVADTNIIFLDQNGNDFIPNLGNDDREFGDRSSSLSWLATYTGYLTIIVGPVNPPPYEESSNHTYEVICNETIATPTPTATNTRVPGTGGTGGTGGFVPTATPIVFPTFPPTPTPIDPSIFFTPTPQPPPVVQFQPLPTATPFAGGQQSAVINVTVFYDSNNSNTPELNEGIVGVGVAVFDNVSGSPLSFGLTNEAGMIRFDVLSNSGTLRIEVPFLNYRQTVVGGDANILIRVAPQPLPGSVP